MIEAYGWWLVRWRYAVILLCLILVGLAASGGRFLQFTNDYRAFFSKENPQLKAFESLQSTYTKNDNVLLVIEPMDGKIFSRATLASIEKLTKRAWQTPFSIRVDSITNFQYTHAQDDDLIVKDMVGDAAQLSDADLSKVQNIVLHEPLLVRRLVSPTGHVAGVNVTVQLPGIHEDVEGPEVVKFVRALANEVHAENPNLRVHLTGVIMLNSAFFEASMHDMQTLTPLMFLVVLVSIGLLLRVYSGPLITVAIIVASILTAMGLTGWLGIRLTAPTVSAPTIILTLAVADCVHLLASFLYNLRHGMDKKKAMVESLRINFQPVFLTSFTTAIGFLSMNFSDAPPFRDLGNIVAMGVTAAWALSVTLLPALTVLLPFNVRVEKTRGHRTMEGFSEFVIRYRRALLWGSAALVGGLGYGLTRNELNDQFVNYFSPEIEFRRATDFTAANLTGIYSLDYSLSAGAAEAVSDPAYLNKVEEFTTWLRQQPEVVHVNSITDIMKRLNRNLHGDDPAWYRIPDNRELAAQYLLLYEMSLPYGLDLNNQINVDKSATRLGITLKNLSSKEMLAIEQRAHNWLIANAPLAMQVDGSSPTVMFAHIGQRNIRSMLLSTTVALVLISISLIVAFRSIKIGLVSMIPNLVPAIMGFGLWGLIDGRVGLGLSIVSSMTLGIVVDDTIHFLSKYLRARREKGLSPEDATRYAFGSVGTAMWVTSAVLVAGFLVFLLSDFVMNSTIGLLTAITIALALAADFLMLPPLILKFEETRDAHAATTVEPATP